MLPPLFFFFLLLIFLASHPQPTSSLNITSFSISDSPWLPTQNKLLTSPNSTFGAGFLRVPAASPSSQPLFTFVIYYLNQPNQTIVWSATKYPLTSNASLFINATTGQLQLANTTLRENLWPGSASSAVGSPNATKLRLLEAGNLVYSNWGSFDFPTDTFLPNQSIGNRTQLVSRNGKFSLQNSNSLVFNYSETYWTNGNSFQVLNPSGTVSLSGGGTFYCSDFGASLLRRLTLDDDGNLRVYSFDSGLNQWRVSWQAIQELCTIHGTCGANAICVSDSSDNTRCECPLGFVQSPDDQDTCVRRNGVSTSIRTSTAFSRMDYVNFTGGSNQTDLKASNFSDCQAKCVAKPNCLGFMFKYDGSGYCVLQLDRMLYGYWSPGTETAFFLRVDPQEANQPSNFTGMTTLLETTCPVRISLPLPPDDSNSTTRNIIIIITLFAAELISGVMFFWVFLKKYNKYRDMARTLGMEFLPAGGPKRFSYAELKLATGDFSNPIGKGGYGDVYKGELHDKRVVAVKCLKNVAGGDAEFWAEVTIIARMHHLNLVRLWGFCAEKGQRILVYEYVPNGSLDKFLFPAGQQVRSAQGEEDIEMHPSVVECREPVLDWGIRYRIALGVARAIAYLHEECLEWVLHCDIKPENILLGDDFCPKIADFGLAKLRKKEDMVSMSRLRGTRGYMAPEWVRSDPITSKADVYSFGMVLLEIVTGTRNFDTQGSLMDSEDWYFPRWAFDKVFKEMKVEDILDRQIKHSYDARLHFDMIDRMVKTAMWCLQDRPDARPSMGKVAKMIEGTVEILEPKKPTIFFLADD